MSHDAQWLNLKMAPLSLSKTIKFYMVGQISPAIQNKIAFNV